MINLTDGKEAVQEFHDATLAQPDLCESGRVWIEREALSAKNFAELLDRVITDPRSKPVWRMWWRVRLSDILSDEIKAILVEAAIVNAKVSRIILDTYGDDLTDSEKALLQDSIDNS